MQLAEKGGGGDDQLHEFVPEETKAADVHASNRLNEGAQLKRTTWPAHWQQDVGSHVDSICDDMMLIRLYVTPGKLGRRLSIRTFSLAK